LTKKLTLLRHAKSGWDDPSLRDFDRPLNDRGKRAAHLVGEWMNNAGLAFDYVVASPAARVTETIEYLAQGYGRRFEPHWERRVYLASSATLFDIISETADDIDHLLLVGHNPGMEDVLHELAADQANAEPHAGIFDKFPTATVAHFTIAGDSWKNMDRSYAKLAAWIRPRDLDPDLGPED
jgi:phosphohistidine phosphatase